MRAGLMRELIEIQERVDTDNSYGEPVADWQTVRLVRAKVEPMEGSEFFRADTTLSDRPVTFTVRYDRSWVPTAEGRIVWREEEYDIKSVADSGARKRTHEIMAVRRA